MSVKNYFNKEILNKLRDAFDEFDDDNDGEIDSQMLERAIRTYGLNPLPEEMKEILNDLGQNNIVSFNTFVYFVYHLSRASNPEKELFKAFQLLDRDGTGKIPIDLAQKTLQSIQKPLTEIQLEMLINDIDVDNGFIDYGQLVKKMLLL